MSARYRDSMEAMIERGVALLRSGLTESAMRRQLAAEFNFDHRDLVCVETAAGMRHQRERDAARLARFAA